MILNYNIADIEIPDGICSPIYVKDEILGLFYIHQSFLLNIQDMHKLQTILNQIFCID